MQSPLGPQALGGEDGLPFGLEWRASCRTSGRIVDHHRTRAALSLFAAPLHAGDAPVADARNSVVRGSTESVAGLPLSMKCTSRFIMRSPMKPLGADRDGPFRRSSTMEKRYSRLARTSVMGFTAAEAPSLPSQEARVRGRLSGEDISLRKPSPTRRTAPYASRYSCPSLRRSRRSHADLRKIERVRRRA